MKKLNKMINETVKHLKGYVTKEDMTVEVVFDILEKELNNFQNILYKKILRAIGRNNLGRGGNIDMTAIYLLLNDICKIIESIKEDTCKYLNIQFGEDCILSSKERKDVLSYHKYSLINVFEKIKLLLNIEFVNEDLAKLEDPTLDIKFIDISKMSNVGNSIRGVESKQTVSKPEYKVVDLK